MMGFMSNYDQYTREELIRRIEELEQQLGTTISGNQCLSSRFKEQHGVEILDINNGLEAVELFQNSGSDLILMDLKMPEMDGLEVTRQIRILSEHVPIVALTAFAYDSDKEAV